MDIVERLRNSDDLSDQQITFACVEAADAIERLHADLRIAGDKFAEVCDENERLRAALKEIVKDHEDFFGVEPLSPWKSIANAKLIADEQTPRDQYEQLLLR